MILGLLLPLSLWNCNHVSSALDLTVNIHYPEKHSPVDLCGFSFVVEVASAIDPSNTVTSALSKHQSENLYVANVSLSSEHLNTQPIVSVLAKLPKNLTILWGKRCQEICPRLSPQGHVTNSGPFTRTQPLTSASVLDVWPDFACKTWSSLDLSFFSTAIGRQVDIRTRLPAAPQENALARPSSQLPPVLFRLNAEWYFDHPAEVYDSWHSLMVTGEMEPVVIVEVYIKGVDWQSWDDQPIYTTELLRKNCGQCDPELQFICDAWEKSGYAMYEGGNHSLGHAPAFFLELWQMTMPQVLQQLPERTDNQAVRTGVWGYCIGGLAAWNAMTTHPDLYNLAYIGSPAIDYDCGDPFRAVSNVSLDSHRLRPKIYIDSGADEGYQMNTQSLLLFRKLQQQGMVEGRDVFYSRLPFGTHQDKLFKRRALKALMVMFGSGSPQTETSQSSPFFSSLTYTFQPQFMPDSAKLDPTLGITTRVVAAACIAAVFSILWILRCLQGNPGKKTILSTADRIFFFFATFDGRRENLLGREAGA